MYSAKAYKLLTGFVNKFFAAAAISILLLLTACNFQQSVGFKKDLTTGLTASYKNMQPEKVMLVMNNEVLGHTDIPVGESFLLINDGIEGLVAKDGKVAVGCSLLIADKQGKVILQEADLFKGNDVFKQDSARMLKCIINTGAPMQSDEFYDVKVVFWDKQGKGSIENKVTIKMIDMP